MYAFHCSCGIYFYLQKNVACACFSHYTSHKLRIRSTLEIDRRRMVCVLANTVAIMCTYVHNSYANEFPSVKAL